MCGPDDYPEPMLSKWRRARKSHRCYACHEEIRPGDSYHATAQKDDDRFLFVQHCARCWAMGQAILAAGADSWQYDLNCGVTWKVAFGDDAPPAVEALAFLTPDEAQLITRRDRWGELDLRGSDE